MLVVGIVLALMASIGGDLMTYIAPTRDGGAAIRTTGVARSDSGKSSTGKSSTGKSSTGKAKVSASA